MKGTPLSLSLYSPLSPNSNGATISTTRVSPNTPEHNARARHETRATEVCTGGGPSALIKGSSGRAALSPSRTVLTAHKRTPQKRRNPFSLFFGLFISVSRWSLRPFTIVVGLLSFSVVRLLVVSGSGFRERPRCSDRNPRRFP